MSKSGNSISSCVSVALTLLFAIPSFADESDGKKAGLMSQLFKNVPVEGTVGLNDWRKRETLTGQLKRIREEVTELKQELGSTDDEDDIDDIEDSLEILEFLEKWASDTLRSNPSEKDILSLNAQITRALAVFDKPVRQRPLQDMLSVTGNVVSGFTFGNPIPRLSPARQNRVMGLAKAKDEAGFLYDPRNRSFFTTEQLAGMTPEEVSSLDVSPEHPAWYREDVFTSMRSHRLDNFDDWMQAGMNTALRADGDLKKGEIWDMHAVRKVLFMKEIYLAATSPKGIAEDAFGVDWKVKWGDEVQTEPVSSRLYLLAGAKITDANFASGYGPEAMVLILDKPGSYEEEKRESGARRSPETLDQLKQTLHDFYGFDLTPYIHSYGVITEANAGRILRNLPPDGKKKFRRKNLIGREWVSFRESMVELRPKEFIRRFDSSTMSDLAAVNDRAARGVYLFNLWLTNRDCKDDNNKSFFIRDATQSGKKMEIKIYREGQHDLGVTMGVLGSSGRINGMTTGSDFARSGLLGSNFRFPQAHLYKPKAWTEATWSDAKWMARRITSISESEIREAVAYSGWPDFMQEALVYKLLARRNRIGELFELTENLDRNSVTAPTICVPLGSSAEIGAAENRYGLPNGTLASELAEMEAGRDYVETVVRNGQVVDCRKSAVIRLLTRERHPAGLYDRYRRLFDTNPSCLE